MKAVTLPRRAWLLAPVLVLAATGTVIGTDEGGAAPQSSRAHARIPQDVLTGQEWDQLARSVDRALAWVASRQRGDGSFPSLEAGQPGVTALCALAFLSRGHLPGEGRYGPAIDKSIRFVLSCQQPDGLLTRLYPHMPMWSNNPSHTAIYNHAVAGLMLSEVYGMTRGETSGRIRAAIEPALDYTRKRQLSPKKREGDKGGWRYVKPWPVSDADLSITSWQLMFLRSSRNAGFDVPSQYVDEAMAYVNRCYDPRRGVFLYALYGENRRSSRAMTGAGILALSLGGLHHTEPAQQAGRWLLEHPFDRFNQRLTYHDRFFYGAFYCSNAMFQLGGQYWADFYPTMLRTFLVHQRPDGSWVEEAGMDEVYGNAYSTAMAVLAMTTPYQLLPIFQR